MDVKGNSVDVKGNRVDVKGNSVDVKGNSVDGFQKTRVDGQLRLHHPRVVRL